MWLERLCECQSLERATATEGDVPLSWGEETTRVYYDLVARLPLRLVYRDGVSDDEWQLRVGAGLSLDDLPLLLVVVVVYL